MFLATSVAFMPSSFSRAATCALRISPMFTSAMRRFPCASRSTSCSEARSFGSDVKHDAFGNHRDAIAASVTQTLDDGADERVDDRFQSERLRELFGNQRERRAGGFADSEREMAGLPSHRDHEIPARRGFRVHHEVLDDLGAVVPSGLEPERVDRRGQIEIVVDRLRHVHHVNTALRAFFELHRRVRRVVAANREQSRHVEPQQRDHDVLEMLRIGRSDSRARSRCASRRGSGCG